MKKVICQLSVSLDGFFEGPEHQLDWHLVDEEFNAYAIETLRASRTLIMGRHTYELMAGYWPTAEGNHPVVKDLMNQTPKLVFSRTLKAVDWQQSTLAVGSPAEETARLKRGRGGGLLWVGGSSLAAAFLEQGLLDELRLIVTPVLLGKGRTVLDAITRRHSLKLLSARSFKSGSVILAYQPLPR